MFRNVIAWLIVISFVFMPLTSIAQEFSIAVGADTTMSGGAVFGGENGIVTVYGDMTTPYSINAQLIAYPNTLAGTRISLGAIGIFPGAIPIFDGTNYFLAWCGFDGVIKGQLINTSGNLVGASFTIADNVSILRNVHFGLTYGENSSLVVFVKTNGYLYGQLVDKSGNLVGSQIQISSNLTRELSLAFDGTNYLVTWVKQIPDTDKDVYGQFVSKSGSLVGSNFIIDTTAIIQFRLPAIGQDIFWLFMKLIIVTTNL